MKIINFGSLNIDYVYSVDHLVLPGETISSNNMQIHPGGKGLNQSIAIARAGGEVIHAGMYSEEGSFLFEILEENKVDISELKKITTSNGHAIIEVDKHGENSIVLFSGTNAMINEEYIDSVLSNAKGDEIVLFQNEISSIAYAMRKAKKIGCIIAFNPAPMNEKVLEYPLEFVDILVVNLTEGKMLSGENEPEDILEALKRNNPYAKIILTLGADGSWYSYKDEKFYIKASKVDKAKDTTAAGDTFIGYYLASICKGTKDIDALKIASRAAAKCVEVMGASVSIPNIVEIE